MDDVSPTAPLISVVIPLYNEGSHLRELLADLKRALQDVGCRFEVVLVDDGSSDDTWTKVKDEARIWAASGGVIAEFNVPDLVKFASYANNADSLAVVRNDRGS